MWDSIALVLAFWHGCACWRGCLKTRLISDSWRNIVQITARSQYHQQKEEVLHRHICRKKRKITFCYFKHSGQLNIFLICNLLYQNYKLNWLKNTPYLVPFPHLTPTLEIRILNGIYAEVPIIRCIRCLTSSMEERGSVILKVEIHSLVQSILLSLIPPPTFCRF